MNEPRVDWKKYPVLARVFEHRPDVNIYAKEFRELLDACPAGGLEGLLTKLERSGVRDLFDEAAAKARAAVKAI